MCSMSLTVVVSARSNVRHDAAFHFLGRQPVEGPDHADHRNVDVRKDVGGRAQDGERPDDEQQQSHHDEGVRAAQRELNDPHDLSGPLWTFSIEKKPAGRRPSRPAGNANNPCRGTGMRLFMGDRLRANPTAAGRFNRSCDALTEAALPTRLRAPRPGSVVGAVASIPCVVCLSAWFVRGTVGFHRLAIVVELAAWLVRGATGLDRVALICCGGRIRCRRSGGPACRGGGRS